MTMFEPIQNEMSSTLAPNVVPDGAFSYPVANFETTKCLGFLLLQNFTLLAFSAAVDPLRIANQLSQKPLYNWTVFSETGSPVVSSSGIEIGVDHAIENLPKNLRLLVCSGNKANDAADDKTIALLRRHARFGGEFGSICTGANTLARAGLLEDQAFTLHWENQPGFTENFPALYPTSNRYEIDGKLWTCGGGVATSEMMLAIIQRDYGREFAVAVSDMCLNSSDLDGRTAQRSSYARAVGTRNPKIVQVMHAMHQTIEEPLSLDELAAKVGLSRRQIERHFRLFLNASPMATYRNIRLDRARVLLIETEMTVTEITVACGFNSSSQFSRHYKARFGLSPSAHLNKVKGS